MPRPDDFPVVGGVSGTVTINLTNLPAGVGSEALVVPVEAVFNPDNRPRNEPHVWVVTGEGDTLHLEDRKVSVGQVSAEGSSSSVGLRRVNAWWPQALGSYIPTSRYVSGRVNGDYNGYLSSVYQQPGSRLADDFAAGRRWHYCPVEHRQTGRSGVYHQNGGGDHHYPGASAQQVEEEVTLPLENALQQLPYG